MVERKAVNSSNVVSVGYDPETQTLAVEFKGGNVYHYHDVPGDVADGLMNADSIGSHFAQNIRNAFQFTKQ